MKLKVNPPYKPLVQMPLCCGVCSFLWTLHRRGYWIDQEEIAQACKLHVPKKDAKLFTLKMKIANKKEDEGTGEKKGEKKLIYKPKAKNDELVKVIEINFAENN